MKFVHFTWCHESIRRLNEAIDRYFAHCPAYSIHSPEHSNILGMIVDLQWNDLLETKLN